jgi:hypothetical protein
MDRLGGYWLFVLPAWLWAFLPLWASSDGVVDLLEVMVLFLATGPVTLVWLAGGVICVKEQQVRSLLLWLSAPIVCVAAIVVSATNVPLIVRFHLSEPSLRSYAEGGTPETSRDKTTQVIGLFRVTEVWRHGRTVAFTTSASKVFGYVGVIYAPDGLPTELPMEVEELLFARYTHIDGPWYRFETGD